MREMKPNKLSKMERSQIKDYTDLGLSSRQLGEVFDVSHSTVLRWSNPIYRENEIRRSRNWNCRHRSSNPVRIFCNKCAKFLKRIFEKLLGK